jgi:hypothetical protein
MRLAFPTLATQLRARAFDLFAVGVEDDQLHDFAEGVPLEFEFGLGGADEKAQVGGGKQRFFGSIGQAEPKATVVERDDDAVVEEFVFADQIAQFR